MCTHAQRRSDFIYLRPRQFFSLRQALSSVTRITPNRRLVRPRTCLPAGCRAHIFHRLAGGDQDTRHILLR
jgi:hypothetical protein